MVCLTDIHVRKLIRFERSWPCLGRTSQVKQALVVAVKQYSPLVYVAFELASGFGADEWAWGRSREREPTKES